MDFFFTSFPQYYETWKLAQDNQGAFVALNHRYYGNNPPGAAHMTADQLRFLSVEQALEDYISFAEGLSSERGWKTNPWIVTGISYSGALAAFTRCVRLLWACRDKRPGVSCVWEEFREREREREAGRNKKRGRGRRTALTCEDFLCLKRARAHTHTLSL